MTTEWPTIDSSVGIHTDNDNHADLFGGDLFSDELLDIYNSPSGVAGGPEGVVTLPHDIPHILTHDKPGDDVAVKQEQDNAHEDYDGLGAFRPSTSMSDFTSLLENQVTNSSQAPPANPGSAAPMPSSICEDVHITVNSPSASIGKKRTRSCDIKSEPAAISPPAKKKALAPNSPTKIEVNAVQAVTTPAATLHPATPNKPIISAGMNGNASSTANKMNNNVANNNNKAGTPDPLTLKVANAVANVTAPAPAPAAITPVINQSNVHVAQVAATAATVVNVGPPKAAPVTSTNIVATTYVTQAHRAKVSPPPMVATALPAKTTQAAVSSAASLSSVKTEESFKGVAQAAVNNLILSAGQNPNRYENKKETDANKAIDTSTAHVAALTSNNWVAACAASISDAPPGTAQAAQAAALAAASDPAAAKAARARRATLTADERARQNRDRNREHARNTRLRKKAYVEELKRTLTELVTQRDATELERRHEKQRELEVREVRYRVMEEFLKLRARGSEANLLARWVAILEEGFTLTLPKTDYRVMTHSQNDFEPSIVAGRRVSATDDISSVRAIAPDNLPESSQQVLSGATECFDDASKVATFLNSLNNGNATQSYNCDRKKFMMDGVNAVLDWTLTTANTANCPSLNVKGCMRATFSPASNKLICAELMFDTGCVVTQVKSFVSRPDPLSSISSSVPCIAETDALLDSVLPQVSSVQQVSVNKATVSCSVSVSSADKGESSSDEEGLLVCKQEPVVT